MTDLFYWHRLLLAFLGLLPKRCEVASNYNHRSFSYRLFRKMKSVYKKVVRLFIRFMFIAVITDVVFLGVYNMNDYANLVMLGNGVAFFGTFLLVYHFTDKNIQLIWKRLTHVMEEMSPEESKEVKKQDKLILVERLLITFIPGICAQVYLTWEGKVGKFFLTDFEFHVNAFSWVLCTLVFALTSSLYLMTLKFCRTYALHCLKAMSSDRNTGRRTMFPARLEGSYRYKEMKWKLENYSLLVSNVNDSLGFIPGSIFIHLFTDLVMGVAFVSANKTMSNILLILTFAPWVANHLIVTLQIVHEVTQIKATMNEAVRKSHEAAEAHLPENASHDLLESRRTLSLFLQRSFLRPDFTALSFELNPSVLLIFLNAVVPFTIMIITAVNQLIHTQTVLQAIQQSNSTDSCQ